MPETEGGLRSIPSVIDIPHMLDEHDGESSMSSALLLPHYALAPQTRSRNGAGGKAAGRSLASLSNEKDMTKNSSAAAARERAASPAKHYDADGE